MNYKNITYSATDRAARITLNAPPLNIITIAMMAELKEAIERCVAENVMALVISGAGEKAFSAGVEISEHTPELIDAMLTSFHDVFRALISAQQRSGLVTVAKVNGYCLGGGCELAGVCDFVIASEKSTFGLPEIKLGCYPPVAAALFPGLIGRRQAERLMFSGESIDAEEALRIGLVTEVVAEVELNEKVKEFLSGITDKSSAVLRLLRKSEPDWRSAFLQQLDIAESVYLQELTQLADMQEGIDAYQQKRKPQWSQQ